MYRMFPRLKEREHTEAGVLSGGEQQMLTLCRTLMGDPDLIMIDEPTEGLAPKIVELVAEYLKTLKSRGVSVLLVEQKLTIALRDLRALLRDGPRRDRLRGHAGDAARQRRRAQGVAGGLRRPMRPAVMSLLGQRASKRSSPRIERTCFFAPAALGRCHCSRIVSMSATYEVRGDVAVITHEQPAGQRPGLRDARRHRRRPRQGARRRRPSRRS